MERKEKRCKDVKTLSKPTKRELKALRKEKERVRISNIRKELAETTGSQTSIDTTSADENEVQDNVNNDQRETEIESTVKESATVIQTDTDDKDSRYYKKNKEKILEQKKNRYPKIQSGLRAKYLQNREGLQLMYQQNRDSIISRSKKRYKKRIVALRLNHKDYRKRKIQENPDYYKIEHYRKSVKRATVPTTADYMRFRRKQLLLQEVVKRKKHYAYYANKRQLHWSRDIVHVFMRMKRLPNAKKSEIDQSVIKGLKTAEEKKQESEAKWRQLTEERIAKTNLLAKVSKKNLNWARVQTKQLIDKCLKAKRTQTTRLMGLLRNLIQRYYDPAARVLEQLGNQKTNSSRERVLHDAYCRHQYHVRGSEAYGGKLGVTEYVDLDELMQEMDENKGN